MICIGLCAIAPVSAGGYRDYNPSLDLTYDYGYITFFVHGIPNIFPHLIYVAEKPQDVVYYNDFTLDYPNLTPIEILPDGNTLPMELPAGNYTAYLEKGYGAEPEVQVFKAGGGMSDRVPFVGIVISGSSSGGC